MELVDDGVVQAGRPELLVGPVEGGVEDPRGAAKAVRLPARARVGQRRPVQDELVLVARRGVQRRLVDLEADVVEGVLGALHAQRDRLLGPHAELRAAVAQGKGAEAPQEWVLAHARLAMRLVSRSMKPSASTSMATC